MSENISISGIVQGYDRKAIPGIKVSAYRDTQFLAQDFTYNEEGRYELSVPPGTPITVRFDTHWSMTNIRPDVFTARYGNMFARACKRGGLFVGVLRVETYSEEDANKIEGQLRGSYGLFTGEVSMKFSDIAKTFNASVYCSVYAEGGPPIQIKDPTDPKELLTNANNWIKALHDNPDQYARPYEWTLSPISIAEGPLPLNPVQIQKVQDILTYCAREPSLLDQLNLLAWIRSHPERFNWENAVSGEKILEATRATQVDLDTIADCASAAINDPAEAKMPTVFAAARNGKYPSADAPSPLPKPLPSASAPQPTTPATPTTPITPKSLCPGPDCPVKWIERLPLKDIGVIKTRPAEVGKLTKPVWKNVLGRRRSK